MVGLSRSRWWLLSGGLLLVALLIGGSVLIYRQFFARAVPEAENLRPFVHGNPPVPVVFTSRTEPASFEAAAPEAEGFTFPGTIPWAAREGRLRLLDTDGKVFELTWGRPLPDGGTLVDVMSPSVSLDGKRVLFAGRKAAPDPGRWRIYEVGIDGKNLRQLTGGPDDPGCIALPPMRFAADGSRVPDADRRRIDYDDVDPTDRGNGNLIFASSRLPDLGRDHSRRATQIWYRPAAGPPRTLTANRNNDRWPVLTANEYVLFSLWSRNREAVTDDGSDVQPVSSGAGFATRPTDVWMGARVFPTGIQFGYAVKIGDPVWRPRPLFNGRVAFMTNIPGTPGGLRLAQADWGYIRVAPSSQAGGGPLPTQVGGSLVFGPTTDADGRPLTAGCPSPCPPVYVLFAAARVGSPPGGFGLYLTPEAWVPMPTPQLLFDDPELVDAEPVAVYPRSIDVTAQDPPTAEPPSVADRTRLGFLQPYDGPVGVVENNGINLELPATIPGQMTDAGQGPVLPFPDGIKSVAFYAANRDRFNDPDRPRVPGTWEKIAVVPLEQSGRFRTWVPADPLSPSVLAGLGADGKVFRWSSPAKDSTGRSASFYAVAGDHYSGMRPNGYTFCVGCHTGHTFIDVDVTEKVR